MITTKEFICEIIAFIWGASGLFFFVVYLFRFIFWKKRNKHKMRFNVALIIKWQIIMFISFVPFFIMGRMYQSIEPLIIVFSCFFTLAISYILHELNIIKKHEIFIPFLLWSPAVILMIYKKRQTELFLEEVSKERDNLR